jgi:uncharacterized delta-60 repeat protein
VVTDLGSPLDVGRALAIDAQGRIVVVGDTGAFGHSRGFAARYRSDGTLDPTFAGAGFVKIAEGAYVSFARAVAVDAQGRILVAGGSNPHAYYGEMLVARYDSNGTLDASFGSAGSVLIPFGTPYSNAWAILVDAAQRIVVAGRSGGDAFAIARLLPDGGLDPSFGNGGRTATKLPGSNLFNSLVALDEGYVAAGQTTSYNGPGSAAGVIIKYDNNGAVDTRWAGGPILRELGQGTYFNTAGVMPDGRILVVALVGPFTATSAPIVVIRFLADGTFDHAFGAGGLARIGWGVPVYRPAMAIQPDDGYPVVTSYSREKDGFLLNRFSMLDDLPPIATIDQAPQGFVPSKDVTLLFHSNEVPQIFACSLDGAPWAPCAAPLRLTALAEGVHTWTVRAIDFAGNVQVVEPERATWTVDTVPPETTITSGPEGVVRDRSATFTFVANEPATFECSLDYGATYRACTSPFTVTHERLGQHLLLVRATDRAGNLELVPVARVWTVAPKT